MTKKNNNASKLFDSVLVMHDSILYFMNLHKLTSRITQFRLKRRRDKFLKLFEKCINNLNIDLYFIHEFAKFFNSVKTNRELFQYNHIKERITNMSTNIDYDKDLNIKPESYVFLIYTSESGNIYQFCTFRKDQVEIECRTIDSTIRYYTYFYTDSNYKLYEKDIKENIIKLVKYYINSIGI